MFIKLFFLVQYKPTYILECFVKKSSILNHYYYKKTMKETSIIPCCNHKIRLLLELCPGSRWGSLRYFPRLGRAILPRSLPLKAFTATTSKRRRKSLC